MPLNPAQKSAAEYLEGPLLVLAGPGTGKTQLLSAKVAHILKNTDTAPENILCITFTDSGCENMRSRLLSTIGAAAHDVNIFTYHSFGSFLINQYHNQFAPSARNFDQSLDPVAQFKVIKFLQDRLPATDILKNTPPKDLVDTISSLKNARLSPADLTAILAQNQQALDDLIPQVSPLLAQIVPRMKFQLALPIYQSILDLLLQSANSLQPIAGIPPLPLVFAHDLKAVFSSLDPERPLLSPLSMWRHRTFVRHDPTIISPPHPSQDPQSPQDPKNPKTLTTSDPPQYTFAVHIAQEKLRSLAQIYQSYLSYLSDHHLFDFADMIEEAITALKTDSSFRLTLSERFQFILLDEFQDTNPSQFELIKLLTDYECPQVMAVGDDDQAIFEFQGASSSNLETFRQHYHAHVITLTENYRSAAPVLDLSRHVAEKITDRFSTQNNYQKILTSFISEHKSPECQITRHEFPSFDAEYFWVVNQIHQLIQQGTAPSEIAIIAPKHKYITPLLPFFQKYPDIPLAYERRDNLLKDPILSQIILLARLVYDLSQNRLPSLPLLHLLSLEFLQINPVTALQFAQDAPKHQPLISALVASKTPQIASLGHFLAFLVSKSFDSDITTFLNHLINPTSTLPLTPETPCKTHPDAPLSHSSLSNVPPPVTDPKTSKNASKPLKTAKSPETTFTPPHLLNFYTDHQTNPEKTFTFYENLLVLVESLKKYTHNPAPTLADFVNFIDDYTLAEQSIQNTSPYKNSRDAVQILSAHKSKGLEFQHVFLIAVDNLSWGRSKGNNNLLVLPPNLASIRHTGATEDERLRLFFVAITRAKTHLTMTNSLSDFTGKSNDRLAYLNEAEFLTDQGLIIKSPFIPTGCVTPHLPTSTDLSNFTDLTACWSQNYLPETPDIQDLLTAKLQNYRLSATNLTSFLDIIYSGPQNFYQSHLLPNLATSLTESQIYGNIMHKTLQKVTNEHLSLSDAQKFALAEIHATTSDPQLLKNLTEKSAFALDTLLPQYRDLLTSPHARSEVNFAQNQLSLSGIPLTGIIDHLQIDPQAKTITIYDFKTGKYPQKSWHSHPTMFMYMIQLIFYKILVELSPEYKNYTVTAGHILFITPDSQGLTYNIPLQYTAADETLVRSLIPAVYHLITTLAFTKDPDLFLEANKSYTLKSIREFIKKVLEKANSLC